MRLATILLAQARRRPEYSQFTRLIYKLSVWNQYGLKYDDLLSESLPEVVEATRRLPPEVDQERNFRLIRANQLCLNHRILPKEEWTEIEEDDHYMDPYIEEVLREEAEKIEWDKKP